MKRPIEFVGTIQSSEAMIQNFSSGLRGSLGWCRMKFTLLPLRAHFIYGRFQLFTGAKVLSRSRPKRM